MGARTHDRTDGDAPPSVLVLACGALARELIDVIRINQFDHMSVACLPAKLHNRPQEIPAALKARIDQARPNFDRILVLYGDCGTGGGLDRLLAAEGIERIPGPHCYEFYAGSDRFADMADREPGTFYLTDYLARHFDRLIIEGLGLDRHPELRDAYFGNYTTVMYLAQTEDAALEEKAQAAAERLGLAYERHFTGCDGIASFLQSSA